MTAWLVSGNSMYPAIAPASLIALAPLCSATPLSS
jgi:hypothetical protein